MKITKREIIGFLLGIVTCFLVDTALDWENVKDDFNEGYDAAQESGYTTE